jgi:histidinol-phosphate aminotransferase
MFELNKLVRKNIASLKPYSSARKEFAGSEGIFLDANENPFGNLNRYPDPLQLELKTKLSNLKNIPVENIFIGNGSDEVIDLAFRIFCNPGKDKALTFSPTYGMYQVSADINDIQLIQLPLNSEFQIDFETFLPYTKDENIKLIFVCSPNNPTANSIKNIEKVIENFNGIVVVDEAYIDFSEAESLITKIDKYPNLIVSQTFSKAWALASARVGIAYMNKDIVNLYNNVKPPYNVSKLNQVEAINALAKIDEYGKNKLLIISEKKSL